MVAGLLRTRTTESLENELEQLKSEKKKARGKRVHYLRDRIAKIEAVLKTRQELCV